MLEEYFFYKKNESYLIDFYFFYEVDFNEQKFFQLEIEEIKKMDINGKYNIKLDQDEHYEVESYINEDVDFLKKLENFYLKKI